MRLEATNIAVAIGGRQILKDISLAVDGPALVAVVGPSGSGKTMLLECLGGIRDLDSGKVTLDGKEIGATEVSWVHQRSLLVPWWTPKQNLEIARTLSADEYKRTLRSVGLGSLPPKARSLSGGEAQRIALGRALVSTNDVIFADEPTGQLDTETTRQVVKALIEVAKTKLIVAVTHDEGVAEATPHQLRFSNAGLVST